MFVSLLSSFRMILKHILIKKLKKKTFFWLVFPYVLGVKNDNFHIFIKLPEIPVSGCYIAQNVRNEQTDPKIYVISHVSHWKYENSTKKSPGVQNAAKYFLSLLVFLSFLVKI